MSYKPNDPYFKEVVTSNPATGAALNADSLPVATANHNGTDDGTFTLTVTNLDAGRYKITGTVPAGYSSGDVVNVSVAATVSTVAGKAIVDTFVLDSKRLSDLQDITAASVWAASTRTLSAFGFSVTASSVTDKTGYSLAQTFPANFASASIDSSGRVLLQPTQTGVTIPTVTSVNSLTTYTGNTPQTGDSYARLGAPSGASIDADILSRLAYSSYTTPPTAAAIGAVVAAGSVATVVGSVGSVVGLAVGNLDVAVSTLSTYAGADTSGTTTLLSRVTGLVASHSDAVAIETAVGSPIQAGGSITVSTVLDKTGYSLASSGLDAIAVAPPSGPASTFAGMVVQLYRRFFAATVKSASTSTIKTLADDNSTTITTQVYSDDNQGNETLGAAS